MAAIGVRLAKEVLCIFVAYVMNSYAWKLCRLCRISIITSSSN